MENPFEIIDVRLSRIEDMLRELLEATKVENKSETQEKDLLTVKEAAEFLDLTVPTIYSKVCKKELPFIKSSKRTYFSRKELMAYLRNGRKSIETPTDLVDTLKPLRKIKKNSRL